jgi:glutamate 5-kinase
MASTRPESIGPTSDTHQQSKIVVLKIGTSTICDEKTFIPKLSNLSLLVEAIVELRKRGHQVILVSSGAVGVGLRRLSLSKRPKHLAQVQVWPFYRND